MNIEIIKQHAIAAVNARIAEVVELSNTKFGTEFVIGGNLTIDLGMRGKSGGQACLETRFGIKKYKMRINVGLMLISEKNWWHVLDETISHEMAHIVDYAKRGTSGHCRIWKGIHLALGGNAKRCHDMTVKQTGQKYVVAGKEYRLKKAYHDMVQAGSKSISVRVNGVNYTVEKKHHVGDFSVDQLDYVLTRNNEPVPVINVPNTTPTKTVKATTKIAANDSADKKYVSPSGKTTNQKPSELGIQIWNEGFVTQEAFEAEYEARGGKGGYRVYGRCVRWFK